MAEVGSLEEAALKRRERLKAMRTKDRKEDTTEPPNKKIANEESTKLPKPVFRSYQPHDDTLKEHKLSAIKPSEVAEYVQDQMEMAKPEPLVDEVDLTSLAPRKPDWDLKRDIAGKLAKLEKRTQRAIAELIRERLQSGEEDLSAVVGAAPPPELDDDED